MSNKNEQLKEIGTRIRATRNAKKMSQEELAYKSNVAVSNISDIELGKKDIRISTFISVIEALGVPADEILQPDVPQVNIKAQNEIAEMLSDCSKQEIDTIKQLINNILNTWRNN